jgi:hypothetical protein
MSELTDTFNKFHDSAIAFLQKIINTTQPGTPEHEAAIAALEDIENQGRLG